MKRISTNSIKRLLVLGELRRLSPPSAAKADPFFAPDNGFVNITATCDYFCRRRVTTISTSDYRASQRLWLDVRERCLTVSGSFSTTGSPSPDGQRYEPVT